MHFYKNRYMRLSLEEKKVLESLVTYGLEEGAIYLTDTHQKR